MRKPIVAGNWKMNGTRCQVIALLESLKQAHFSQAVDVVIFPSFVFLQQTEDLLAGSSIAWGGQNIYLDSSGAFTGEISGPMLVDYGCEYVLIGHSERRLLFKEDLSLVAAKFKAAIDSNLKPMLCVGETLEQRNNHETETIIQQQIESVIALVGIEAFRKAVIAYEPVWAIGTGLTATPEQAQAVHLFIRKLITKYHQKIADNICLLYGGSVKADNAAGLFSQPDIDGGLVGGASLDAKSFLTICQAALGKNSQITESIK